MQGNKWQSGPHNSRSDEEMSALDTESCRESEDVVHSVTAKGRHRVADEP